jgi:hypothetical protein
MRFFSLPVIALVLSLAACSPAQVSASMLATYNGAVAAEIAYLSTGKATPAEREKLAQLRRVAWNAVQQVEKAEGAGQNVSGTALVTAASAALAAYVAETDTVQGKTP